MTSDHAFFGFKFLACHSIKNTESSCTWPRLFHSICSGVELLKKYKEEYLKFEKERQELTNAERLFDLNITMYQDMQQMEREIKGMEMIYSIYEKQKVRLPVLHHIKSLIKMKDGALDCDFG